MRRFVAGALAGALALGFVAAVALAALVVLLPDDVAVEVLEHSARPLLGIVVVAVVVFLIIAWALGERARSVFIGTTLSVVFLAGVSTASWLVVLAYFLDPLIRQLP